ncbi:MAG: c-type cytochrome biogenesis protein CcsB [Deltaproteobacteria bacterium HGW-Deltaproteobacteria-19]|jgi:cytochrome c-type biogenesis protein CcsB|nr:MAG: c-type cytochrome biogenesis protein CcsB [Deltaproteobacteria bacterium HGW-Deltaproteobacteria-19]
MDILVFKAALAAYLFSALGYIASLLVKRVHVARIATWLLAAAFVIHAGALVLRFMAIGRAPVVGLHDMHSLIAWIMTGVYLAFQFKTKTRVLGVFVAPVAFLVMVTASAGLGGTVTASPKLEHSLVTIHVILSLAGEALFVLAALAGLMYLIQDKRIKEKKISRFSRFLPPLTDLDRINELCLLWGFPLLTLGVLTGSIWARVVWGSAWQWDAKMIWTLLAWVIFALLLHQRLAIGWRGRKAALYSVAALLVLLLTFVMEKSFFTTVHRFL